jgi:hypothetical protein
MADCQIYGLNPSGHHLTNLLLHTANTLLLLGILWKTTDRPLLSALVAGLFGLHPLHVESVAWVSERKDVLSTLFWLLSIWTYVVFVRKGGALRYAATASLVALGLMAKPMVVTAPLVFLLMDYWPLSRMGDGRSAWTPATFRRRLVEKLPLFGLSIACGAATILVQGEAGAIKSGELVPLWAKFANAPVSYLSYVLKTVWPANLAALYPHPYLYGGVGHSSREVAFSILALLLLTAIVIASNRKYAAVGWLWYLITLGPVIGIIQMGHQAMADRYTYVPSIGLFIIFAWGGAEIIDALRPRIRAARSASVIGCCVLLAGMTLLSRRQAGHWRDSVALFERTLSVTERNPIIENFLGVSLASRERHSEALDHYENAVGHYPEYATAHDNRAWSLYEIGDNGAAIEAYRRALSLEPSLLRSRVRLSWILATSPGSEHRNGDEALTLALEAVERNCELTAHWKALLYDALGASYAEVGRFADAIEAGTEALRWAGEADTDDLTEEISARLARFRKSEPHREPSRPLACRTAPEPLRLPRDEAAIRGGFLLRLGGRGDVSFRRAATV